jgi:hypothetical protein
VGMHFAYVIQSRKRGRAWVVLIGLASVGILIGAFVLLSGRSLEPLKWELYGILAFVSGRGMVRSRHRGISPMRLHDRFEPQGYGQRSQEIRRERKAETKQAERLSAILAKKASSPKAERSSDSAAY